MRMYVVNAYECVQKTYKMNLRWKWDLSENRDDSFHLQTYIIVVRIFFGCLWTCWITIIFVLMILLVKRYHCLNFCHSFEKRKIIIIFSLPLCIFVGLDVCSLCYNSLSFNVNLYLLYDTGNNHHHQIITMHYIFYGKCRRTLSHWRVYVDCHRKSANTHTKQQARERDAQSSISPDKMVYGFTVCTGRRSFIMMY